MEAGFAFSNGSSPSIGLLYFLLGCGRVYWGIYTSLVSVLLIGCACVSVKEGEIYYYYFVPAVQQNDMAEMSRKGPMHP